MNKYMYYACLNAGMSKKEISRLENVLDADWKKLKRQNKAMEKAGITMPISMYMLTRWTWCGGSTAGSPP